MISFPTLAILLSLSAGLIIRAEAASKPNVILIMADDLGYHDLGCYDHPSIKTPTLDGVARDGIRLTNFHSGATVCTPSRMALLTGTYPVRLGWTQGVVGYLMGPHDGMSSDALTMAEIFKSAGYKTGISGKWHLGDQPTTRPGDQGFEEAYYIPLSNNQTTKVYRGDKLVEDPFENRLLTEQFTTEAIRFIKKNQDDPFFLYLPYSAPHFPVEPHPEWKGRSSFGDYGDVVEELDARIGEILATLDELKIAENTIVVFTSDNGPNPREKAGSLPYRGEKWSALEGGTRVPCLLRWLARMPKGRESAMPVNAMDLLPTLCSAAGIDWKAKTHGNPPIDGRDVLDLLLTDGTDAPQEALLYWMGKSAVPRAIRVGKWKLFFKRSDALQGPGTARRSPEQAQKIKALMDGTDSPILFNLKEDPGETLDLSLNFPRKVEDLKKMADGIIEEINTSKKLEIFKVQ